MTSEQEKHQREDLTVETQATGQRLDKWLASRRPDLSRSRIQALIASGCVCSAGATITDIALKVKSGATFSLVLPPEAAAEPEPENIPLAVVYEDSDLIVIDKPAGLVVHPAAGHHGGTLVNALLHHCGDSLSGIGGVRRPGIVHRLDMDTSGLLVVAKNDQAHHGLAEQFAAHTLQRAYRAVVWGTPVPAEGSIAGNIGRSPRNRKKMAVVTRGGKPAVTHYRVEKRLAGGQLAVVVCRLATGRTHQIRVHMTEQGHPLVGDPLYGAGRPRRATALSEEQKDALKAFSRQALHAWQLGFIHPVRQVPLSFTSELPEDMQALLLALDSPLTR